MPPYSCTRYGAMSLLYGVSSHIWEFTRSPNIQLVPGERVSRKGTRVQIPLHSLTSCARSLRSLAHCIRSGTKALSAMDDGGMEFLYRLFFLYSAVP